MDPKTIFYICQGGVAIACVGLCVLCEYWKQRAKRAELELNLKKELTK